MKKKSNKRKYVLATTGFILVCIVICYFTLYGKDTSEVKLETEKVASGKIKNTVTATGTIQAIKTVEVGTQVSGVIDKMYVDYNSVVKKDQLLAELDKRPLLSSLENAQANYENAKAEVTYHKSNYERVNTLYEKKLISKSDYDLALYNYTKAQASLKTAVSELNKSKINLEYSRIYSPIDGVILSRAVNEGQTVAASFSTPTLFTIANDLTRMQVEASIDEADIGLIRNGQKVTFTVDAFPDDQFNGEVTEVRLLPVTKSNVVTYTVIINAPNPDKKLMPGMTANITIVVEESENSLLVSSRALKFMPDSSMIGIYSIAPPPRPDGKHPVKPDDNGNTALPSSKQKMVWLIKGTVLTPVSVKTGIDDGDKIQILSGLKAGDEVVLAISSADATSETKSTTAQQGSPFMPKGPGPKK
jgi:HlyD family secretion protein